MLDELQLSPNASFERDIICDAETIKMTAENMKAIRRYHDEVRGGGCVGQNLLCGVGVVYEYEAMRYDWKCVKVKAGLWNGE